MNQPRSLLVSLALAAGAALAAIAASAAGWGHAPKISAPRVCSISVAIGFHAMMNRHSSGTAEAG